MVAPAVLIIVGDGWSSSGCVPAEVRTTFAAPLDMYFTRSSTAFYTVMVTVALLSTCAVEKEGVGIEDIVTVFD